MGGSALGEDAARTEMTVQEGSQLSITSNYRLQSVLSGKYVG